MESRIVAIDLRSQLLGFAALEGPTTLLDWGRRRFQESAVQDQAIVLRKKVAALLIFFVPSILVLKCASGRNDQEPSKYRVLVEAIQCEAKMQSVEIAFVSRKDVRDVFRQDGNISKYRIAAVISEMFPELAWELPPKRENYKPEHHSMPVFDAISIGLTYFAAIRSTAQVR